MPNRAIAAPPPLRRRGLSLALIALLLTPLGAFAQTAPEPPPDPAAAAAEAAAPAQVGVKEAAIDAWLPPDQLVWLDANGEQFPARYRAALTAAPRGAVLVLHDAGQHPSWPATLAALFEELPRHGWHTLAMALPAPTTTTVAGGIEAQRAAPNVEPAAASSEPPASGTPAAPTPDPAPPAEEPAPAEAPAAPVDPEAQARARTAAALTQLQGGWEQGPVVIAGFGNGALRALNLLSDPQAPVPAAALVMVDFPVLDATAAAATRQQLARLTLPTLDIQQGNTMLAAEQAELRQLVAQKTPARLYTRLQLPTLAAPAADSTTTLVRRIRGWLQRNAVETGDR